MQKLMMLWCGLLLLGFTATAQVKDNGPMKFDKTMHNFGKIPKEKPVTVSFTFTNTTGKPLIIEDATAECGCTKPEFPTRPIAAGKSGTIKVTYDAKEPGAFTKKVTVKLVNVAQPSMLTIKGEVI